MKQVLFLSLLFLGGNAASMPHEGMRPHHQATEQELAMLDAMDNWYATEYHSYVGQRRLGQEDEAEAQDEEAGEEDQEAEEGEGGEEGDEETDAVKAKWRGVAPLFGRNLLSVLFTDLVNVIIAPGGPSLLALMIDSTVFLLFPVIGGLVNMSVLYNYDQDPVTFSNSGLEKQALYAQLMGTIKDAVFEFIGRPKFYDVGYSNETAAEPAYEAPQDTDMDAIYVVPDGLDEFIAEIIPEIEVFEFWYDWLSTQK